MKIGVFDSGIGGLTVLAELRKRFPEAAYVYLGDTANVPYGTKSPAQIERLARDGARWMRELAVDALVVACNTASSLALEAIREEMGEVPVFGVVGPGVQAVLEALAPAGPEGGVVASELITPILVLATTATVRSEAYGRTLREALTPDAIGTLPLPIIEQACPLLVPMIEEGWIDHPILHQTLREYVGGHTANYSGGIVLLGCTHYPWIQAAVQKALPGWRVINSAQSVADALSRSDWGLGKGNGKSEGKGPADAPGVEWIFTDPQAVPAFARRWMEDLSN